MKSILKEFARGNISPEVGYFSKNSEYGREMKRLADSEEKLMSALDGEQKEMLIKHNDLRGLPCAVLLILGIVYYSN